MILTPCSGTIKIAGAAASLTQREIRQLRNQIGWFCVLVDQENLLNPPPMRILIENAESREYLANDGKWTKKADGGRDFGATQAAFEAATREPIGRFNIVCYILQKPRFIVITMDQGTGTCPVQGSPLAISRPARNGSSPG